MKIWEAVCRPDPRNLKTIRGGRLTGKSDINPQWRYQAMTQQFGPCGVGWKYTIDRLWTEPGVDGVVFSFALVSVSVNVDGHWSDPIPGVGGHKLIEAEKSGLYNNDEAYKMSVTDALGVALKMLGVAADIYLGNFDGSKYLTPSAEEERQMEQRQKDRQQKDAELLKTGAAILKAGAEKGTDGLKAAWETMSEQMRKVCAQVKESMKATAAEVDAANRKRTSA